MPRGRLAVALAATMAAGVISVGVSPAAPAAAETRTAVGSRPFAPRYSAALWGNLVQGGNALLAAAGGGTGGDTATAWIDVDQDPATVNSSQARLAIPPGATVAWAGLYWSGERGWTDPLGKLRCGAFTGQPPASPPTPPTAPPSSPAPAMPGEPTQVKVRVGDGGYAAVSAAAFDELPDPAGGAIFQGYADVTGLIQGHQRSLGPVTVADVALAPGLNCGGGWTLFLAYAYPGGPDQAVSPDPAHAPALRSVTVHDGLLDVPAGTTADIVLGGLRTPAKGDPDAHLGLVTYHRVGARVDTVTVNNSPAKEAASAAGCSSTVEGGGYGSPLGQLGPTAPPSCKGVGYDATETRLVPGAIGNSTANATVQIYAKQAPVVPGVVALSTRVHMQIDLAVTTALSPASATVGSAAQLTLAVRNESAADATGVAVTGRIPDGLSLTDAPPAYDTATGVWTVGRVAGRSTVTLVLRVRVDRPGSLVSTAEVTASDWPDADSVPGDNITGQDDTASAALTSVAAPETETPPVTAQAQAPTDPGFTLPFDIQPFALIGLALVALGLILLLAVIIRARSAA